MIWPFRVTTPRSIHRLQTFSLTVLKVERSNRDFGSEEFSNCLRNHERLTKARGLDDHGLFDGRESYGRADGLRNPWSRSQVAQESVQAEYGRLFLRTPKSCVVLA